MFSIDNLNRIKISRGDNATFNIEVYNEDGTPYKMTSEDSLELIVKDFSTKEDVLTVEADTKGYFIFTPEMTEEIEGNFFSYDVKLFTRDSQTYTLVDEGFFEVLE